MRRKLGQGVAEHQYLALPLYITQLNTINNIRLWVAWYENRKRFRFLFRGRYWLSLIFYLAFLDVFLHFFYLFHLCLWLFLDIIVFSFIFHFSSLNAIFHYFFRLHWPSISVLLWRLSLMVNITKIWKIKDNQKEKSGGQDTPPHVSPLPL